MTRDTGESAADDELVMCKFCKAEFSINSLHECSVEAVVRAENRRLTWAVESLLHAWDNYCDTDNLDAMAEAVGDVRARLFARSTGGAS